MGQIDNCRGQFPKTSRLRFGRHGRTFLSDTIKSRDDQPITTLYLTSNNFNIDCSPLRTLT